MRASAAKRPAPFGTSLLDGDGFPPPADCNDLDRDMNPEAEELCNGIDDNCDDAIDLVDGVSVCPDCTPLDFGGKGYLFCSILRSWVAAVNERAGYGYNLVSADSSSENAFLGRSARSAVGEAWWIGFNDRASEGSFVWENGSAGRYGAWGAGEPNNAGNQNCAALNPATYQWSDTDCADLNPFICEAP